MVLQPIITWCIHIDGAAHNHNRRWGAYLIEYAHCARIKSTYGPNLDHVLRALPVANSGRPKSVPIAIGNSKRKEVTVIDVVSQWVLVLMSFAYRQTWVSTTMISGTVRGWSAYQ